MSAETERVEVADADSLAVGGAVRIVRLPAGKDGIPREAIVLRAQDGELRAYLNRCRHLPIPLDGGSREFLSKDRLHLVCLTHGATYRVGDGFCVAGPCSGDRLVRVVIERRDAHVYLLPD